MDKVSQHQRSGSYCQCEIDPRKALGQFVVGGFIFDGLVSPLKSKDKSNTAIGSWIITGGDDLAFGQSSSSHVTFVHGSSGESTWCGCSPSSEVSLVGLNSEGISSFELFDQQPTNLDGFQRVVDLDAAIGEDNLWVGNENPEQQINCETVEDACESRIVLTDISKREYDPNFNSNYESKINPVTGRSEGVVFRHVSKTTPTIQDQSGSKASQKGIK